MLVEFVWSIFYPLCSGLDQGELEITVIGIIDFCGVTSAFECYLYSTRKVENTGYSSLISNAHKLKKYILITMDCCNRRLLLPLEDDGLTWDDIILILWNLCLYSSLKKYFQYGVRISWWIKSQFLSLLIYLSTIQMFLIFHLLQTFLQLPHLM